MDKRRIAASVWHIIANFLEVNNSIYTAIRDRKVSELSGKTAPVIFEAQCYENIWFVMSPGWMAYLVRLGLSQDWLTPEGKTFFHDAILAACTSTLTFELDGQSHTWPLASSLWSYPCVFPPALLPALKKIGVQASR